MVVNGRAVEVKLRVEGIGVELFRLVMVKRLLAVVKRKLVVQGVLFWNRLERKLSAGRPVGAAGARGGRGRGEPLPHQVKRTAKPTLQTGRRRQSQPCGVRSWREHERGAPLSRRPRVVFAKRRGMESEEGAEPLPRPGGGHQKRASWSSGVKPASSAAFSRRAMSSVSRRQCRHSLAKPYAAGVRTSLSLQTEHLRALMWVSFLCVVHRFTPALYFLATGKTAPVATGRNGWGIAHAQRGRSCRVAGLWPKPGETLAPRRRRRTVGEHWGNTNGRRGWSTGTAATKKR